MSPEIKYILSIIGIAMVFVTFYPYLRDIFKGKTKPHAFTWLIWGVLMGIGFVIQILEKGGLGSWVLGTGAIACCMIAISGFYLKQTTYYLSDWLSLIGALIALCIWGVTNNPFYSVLLITLIDSLGFIPTFRKVYSNPDSETLSTWYLMTIRLSIGTAALETYSFNTVFYPGTIIVLNGIVILLIHWKKKYHITQI